MKPNGISRFWARQIIDNEPARKRPGTERTGLNDERMTGSARAKAAARTAYHEAGHTAMALEFGFRLHRVTIVPDPSTGTLGRTHLEPIGKWFRPEVDVTDRTELRIQRDIMWSLAGSAAEQIFTGKRRNHIGATGDYQAAADMAIRLCGSGEEASALIKWLDLRTKAHLRRQWDRSVKPIAEALIARQSLTATEIKQVVQEALEGALAFRCAT